MSVLLDRPALVRSVHRARRRRVRRTVAALTVAVLAMFLVDVLLGTYTVTIPDFLRILGGTEIPGASFIVMENKLPRAVVGLLAGAAFGVSGAVCQTLLRNPLASPDVIGVTSGRVPRRCWGSSCSACGPGRLLARPGRRAARRAHPPRDGARRRRVGPPARAGRDRLRRAAPGGDVVPAHPVRRPHRLGGDGVAERLAQRQHLGAGRPPAARVGLLLPVAAHLAHGLRGLELGDDAAAGLGVPVARVRLGLLLLAVALAAVATAATGRSRSWPSCPVRSRAGCSAVRCRCRPRASSARSSCWPRSSSPRTWSPGRAPGGCRHRCPGGAVPALAPGDRQPRRPRRLNHVRTSHARGPRPHPGVRRRADRGGAVAHRPAREGDHDRRRERLREVHPAARAGPSPATGRRAGAPRRPVDPRLPTSRWRG